MIKECCVAGHRQLQMFSNLTGDGGRLFHKVESVSRPKPQFPTGRLLFRLAEPEPRDSRSVLSMEIHLIGFVAGVCRHLKLSSCKRVNNTGFRSRVGKGSFRCKVLIPYAFNDANQVVDPILLLCLANLHHGKFEVRSLMRQRLRWYKYFAEGVRHYPLCPLLCGVDTYEVNRSPLTFAARGPTVPFVF